MNAMDPPAAPKGLRGDGRALWEDICRGYTLEPHHERILLAACLAMDRMMSASRAQRRHGSVYLDRFGQPRPRPEVAQERDARVALLRSLRELSLDSSQTEEYVRPTRIAGGQRYR